MYENYNFDGFVINLYVDEQKDWLAHFQSMPNVSAFGDTPESALEELKIAWELVKEGYQLRSGDVFIPNFQALSSSPQSQEEET